MNDGTETPVAFPGGGRVLRGLLHQPPGTAAHAGAVLFLPGWSGTRHGPHRMFVHAARLLARQGWTCLRFDYAGRGESDGATADAGIQSMASDAGAAIEWLSARHPFKRLALVGICSGAKVALATAATHPAVTDLALWSAEAMAPLRKHTTRVQKSAHALRQYLRKLGKAETWKKILTFRVNTAMVRKAVFVDESPASSEARQEGEWLRRIEAFPGSLCFIYGGRDIETRLAADSYRQFCVRHQLRASFHEIADANHSFYALDWERRVLDHTLDHLRPESSGATPSLQGAP